VARVAKLEGTGANGCESVLFGQIEAARRIGDRAGQRRSAIVITRVGTRGRRAKAHHPRGRAYLVYRSVAGPYPRLIGKLRKRAVQQRTSAAMSDDGQIAASRHV
jgi:hypothetical protein